MRKVVFNSYKKCAEKQIVEDEKAALHNTSIALAGNPQLHDKDQASQYALRQD